MTNKNIANEPIGTQTPMMEQYLKIKQQHPDSLLFYRLGDFYELFFEDAEKASSALDITLTKRGKHNSLDIPMCGVPFHSVDIYLQKLIKQGFRVAIVEQLESPEEAKKRGAKSVVNRDVVRIITPGTLIEDNLLDAKNCNYLVAIVQGKDQIGLAWLDISTAEFNCGLVKITNLGTELARINPTEILLSEKILTDQLLEPILNEWRNKITPQVNSFFDSKKCLHHLQSYFNVTAIDSFGNFCPAEISASGALIEYVNITQRNNLPHLTFPKLIPENNFMVIDHATRRNLELFYSSSGNHKHTMRQSIDYTITSGGGRKLSKFLSAPLIEVLTINQRLDLIEFFINHPSFCQNLIQILRNVPDTERCLSRLTSRRNSPRDLAAMKNSILAAMNIAALIEQSNIPQLPDSVYECSQAISGFENLFNELKHALQYELPVHLHDGDFINASYNPKLEQLIHLRDNSRKLLEELREKYRGQTGITNLKIEHNNVLGYFIEVSNQQSAKITTDEFIHRQTLISGVRYITTELKELEKEIINVKDSILKLEIKIFDQLVELTLSKTADLLKMADKLAYLDVMSSFAVIATERNFVRPIIDDSNNFDIIAGRHLIVENITNSQQSFTPNDCNLGTNQNLWLLTGPNMAGKSTFLRQNALIAILAQMGSYVPAKKAHIGVVDRVFSRVGASDDLSGGRSTFMVEMVETATILNQATEKSLIILDEIGRGTSTYDGVSIAWSCLEYIHNQLKCRSLFATHYHELTSLKDQLKSLECYSMKIEEWQGKVIFLHQVIAGAADRSYGIHVAELAGIPKSVINRAKQILSSLEKKSAKHSTQELPLFTMAKNYHLAEPTLTAQKSKLEELLKTIDVDSLSPKAALDMIYRLKEQLN